MGPEKTEGLLKGWKPISCKRQVQQIKAWLKKQIMFSEDQKEKLTQAKGNSPMETAQASTSKHFPQQVPKEGRKTTKSNQKAKGKAKLKWNRSHPQNYRISKKEKTAMDNVFNITRNLMKLKNKEEERMNQSFPKK
ncbi:hypothetical protein O181_075487 [Austropuccinia psidii MF-1]|uniref:Uncharacterized protein n=1 Tax=Austropuccinia psidii MF-1 TaxID=1389203 RepID=A0A9Q3FF33_9BASI|nr:hypothetical protein [Austropuccinia psidii MF-1]